MSDSRPVVRIPELAIDIVEQGSKVRKGHRKLVLGKDIKFSTAGLESYAFARWEPVIYDAMVVAAAIEFCDRAVKRPSRGWARRFQLRIPVHDPARWNDRSVCSALHDAVEFLTGDYWSFAFVGRSSAAPSPRQDSLSLPVETQAVLAYSDGMDSRAAAGIVGAAIGKRLVRVRVGSKSWDRRQKRSAQERIPFATVPYDVPCNEPNREASGRSRGFKFALITGIAAYLSGAEEIIVPESGQGAIGPALINVGHAYPDYRNHPLFAVRMQCFINALLGTRAEFVFPRIWHTKGETLREYAALPDGNDWASTRSCWRSSRWTSIDGKLRQCGVCAACMLRRLSVHAAGLTESEDTYVATTMDANSLDRAVSPRFNRRTSAFEEYAIAGVLHMDHLADMAAPDAEPLIARHATLLAPALEIPREESEQKLRALLKKHRQEWKNYLDSLGENSFVKQWARTDR